MGRIRVGRIAYADIAQSVEHLIGNEEVISSNLIISSKKPRKQLRGFLRAPRSDSATKNDGEMIGKMIG